MPFQRDDDSWVLEGVLTTLPADGAPLREANIAPMGPIVDAAMSRFILRPFRDSTTYRNLKATGESVFHVTDDALLIARAAVGRVRALIDAPGGAARSVSGLVLSGACRYYELRVTRLDDSSERTTIVAEAVGSGRFRDFFGFNRARHAVLEAAILATRVHLTGPAPVLEEFERLGVIVEKTGGQPERDAMALLTGVVRGGPGPQSAATRSASADPRTQTPTVQ